MRNGLLAGIEDLASIDPNTGLPSSDNPVAPATIIDNIKDIKPIEPISDPKKIIIKTDALVDPGASLEKEYCFYGQVTDISIFKDLPFEDHEQWIIKVEKNSSNLASAQIRVRKTTTYTRNSERCKDGKVTYQPNEPTYTLCVKRKEFTNETEQLTINNEYEKRIDVDCFELIKSASSKGMIKRRYSMPIPYTNSTYEIDLYHNDEGESFSEWCRVEIEVDSSVMTTKPVMPTGITEVTDKDRINWLFDNIFTATHHSVNK
jgi:hypothetical protein